jgi:hypothetical protein
MRVYYLQLTSKGAAAVRCRQLDGRAAILAGRHMTRRMCSVALDLFSTRHFRLDSLERSLLQRFLDPRFLTVAGRIAGAIRVSDPLGRTLAWIHTIGSVRGGEMLLKVAFVLLLAWLLGVIGLYDIGKAVHVLLLVGLLLLMLGLLRARDAAAAAGRRRDQTQK